MNSEPHILIVDDDPHLRTTLTDILRIKGFAPFLAQTGAEALAYVQSNELDAAVIDLRLGDISGLEVLRGIKAVQPETECIVLTGHASQSSAIEAVNSGVYAYLQKPYDKEQFLLLLQRAVERRATTQALRASEELHRVTLESISDAIFLTDDDGNFTYICPNTQAIFGYDQAEVVALGVIEGLLGPDSFFDPVELAAQGELANLERRVLTKAGEERIVLVNVKRVSIGYGTLLYTCRDISDRREAEEKIRFQANLLSAVNSAVIATDIEGRVTYWNQATEELYGWSASEAIGNNILSLTPTEQTQEQAIGIMEQLGKGRHWSGEFRVRRKDGSDFPAFVVNSPVVNAVGKLSGIVGISTDISERKEAEVALQRQLQELTLLHEIALACAEATNPDELIGTVTRIIGDSLYPDHLGVLLVDEATGDLRPHPSYRGLAGEVWQRWETVPAGQGVAGQVAASGQPLRVPDVSQLTNYLTVTSTTRSELCVPLTLGRRVIGVINAESAHLDFFNGDDERLLFTVAGQLASTLEHLRLFAETRQRAEEIGQIIRTVPDGVLLLGEDQRLLQANPAGREYVALLGNAAIGDSLIRLGDQPVVRLFTSPPSGQWHEIRKDRRIFETIAHPLTTQSTPGGWVLVLREVTGQREVQELLRRQERLAAVGQLAAGIAHDFNNLMGAILLHAQLLDRSPGLSEKDRERLSIIQAQTRHASAMIEQILDFSRRSVLERHPLDLLPLLKEQTKLLERTLPEHIQIELVEIPDTYGESEYIVQADPTRIQQMVLNLAINARDAMPQGGRFHLQLDRLRLERASQTPLAGMGTGEWVRLTVSDTGMGMSPEVLEHLFEPFFTTKAPGKGTGLGLAQVYGIVGQHGGHIAVNSQIGQGTVFTIYLPALTAAAQSIPAASTDSIPQGNGELLLLVEDNESLRNALAEYLEMCNYRTLTARSGQDALALLTAQEEAPALVLSDVVMPQMGGLALLHALRQQGNRMPFILLTGHPLDRTEMESLRSQGVTAWLSKPLDLTELVQAIAHGLGEKTPR